MRKLIAALAAFFFVSCSLFAQAPNPTYSIRNFAQLRTFLSSSAFTHVVTVDKTVGVGDYTTIKAACDYVATQVRSATARWVIFVYPGTYAESPFTVPTYTNVSGVYSTATAPFGPQINVTTNVASGIFITLQGSWSNINVEHTATLTGATTLFEVSTNTAAAISNSVIYTFASTATHPLTMVNVPGGATNSVWVYYTFFATAASGANLIMLNQDGTGSSYVVDSMFQDGTQAPLAGIKVNAGTMSVVRTELGRPYSESSFVAALHQTGGNLYVVDSQYKTSTGTIRDDYDRPKTRRITDTLPAVCTLADTVVDIGTVKRFCVCVAANTWNCTALAAP